MDKQPRDGEEDLWHAARAVKPPRRCRVRRWHALGVIPGWLLWVNTVGWVQHHDCSEGRINDYILGLPEVPWAFNHGCHALPMSWRTPLRFSMATPDDLFAWLIGGLGALGVAAIVLYRARRVRAWYAAGVAPFLAVFVAAYPRAVRLQHRIDAPIKKPWPAGIEDAAWNTYVQVLWTISVFGALAMAAFVVYLARRQARILEGADAAGAGSR